MPIGAAALSFLHPETAPISPHRRWRRGFPSPPSTHPPFSAPPLSSTTSTSGRLPWRRPPGTLTTSGTPPSRLDKLFKSPPNPNHPTTAPTVIGIFPGAPGSLVSAVVGYGNPAIPSTSTFESTAALGLWLLRSVVLAPFQGLPYNKDPSPVKVNLGVGAYRTEEGKPLVLNVIRCAENMLINSPSLVKEYLPITGLAEFNKLSAKLIFGADRRIGWLQCSAYQEPVLYGSEVNFLQGIIVNALSTSHSQPEGITQKSSP